jgi:hypothetical protein
MGNVRDGVLVVNKHLPHAEKRPDDVTTWFNRFFYVEDGSR